MVGSLVAGMITTTEVWPGIGHCQRILGLAGSPIVEMYNQVPHSNYDSLSKPATWGSTGSFLPGLHWDYTTQYLNRALCKCFPMAAMSV